MTFTRNIDRVIERSCYRLLIFAFGVNFISSSAPSFAEAQKDKSVEEAPHTLEPIVIVPTKSSLLESQDLRKIKIISSEEIEKFAVSSLPELLQHIIGVDTRQRGALGVQADLNLRGSNFEQVLVCVNGVRINDPQTGHHNMDLPVTLMDMERIEILPGHGSSIYGPGAFCGAVNIVTKEPRPQGLALEAAGGDFGLNSQGLSVNFPMVGVNNRLSFSRKESDGYRPDTDFKITSFALNSKKEFLIGKLEYLFGYTDKDFGASSFYSNLYPHEEEHTDTRFFNLKAHINSTILDIDTSLFYRRHSDKFILDRNRPSWYVNYHTSYSYGADLEVLKKLAWGILSAGTELHQEKITSTNLGNHSRDSQAVYAQFQAFPEKRMLYDLGLRLDHYQTWGWQSFPSLSIGYKINPQFRLKASGGRAFRIPSFTDLYYSGPDNVGNEDLTPEKATSAELGLNFSEDIFSSEVNYFRRWSEDLIGWTRASPNVAWEAQNIAEVEAEGIEFEFSLKPKDKLFSNIHTGYIYQDLDSDPLGLNTKYTLNFLRHHAYLGLDLTWPKEMVQNLTLSYKQRVDQRHYFLLDSRLSKRIKKDDFDLEIFLDISNLLNTSYSEQSDVCMPGRWIVGGVKLYH